MFNKQRFVWSGKLGFLPQNDELLLESEWDWWFVSRIILKVINPFWMKLGERMQHSPVKNPSYILVWPGFFIIYFSQLLQRWYANFSGEKIHPMMSYQLVQFHPLISRIFLTCCLWKSYYYHGVFFGAAQCCSGCYHNLTTRRSCEFNTTHCPWPRHWSVPWAPHYGCPILLVM